MSLRPRTGLLRGRPLTDDLPSTSQQASGDSSRQVGPARSAARRSQPASTRRPAHAREPVSPDRRDPVPDAGTPVPSFPTSCRPASLYGGFPVKRNRSSRWLFRVGTQIAADERGRVWVERGWGARGSATQAGLHPAPVPAIASCSASSASVPPGSEERTRQIVTLHRSCDRDTAAVARPRG